MVVQNKSLASSMNARIIGSGTGTVVMAHGFGGDQTLWDKIVPFFVQSNYQVLLFDWAFSGAVQDPSLYDPLRHGSYDGFASDLVALLDEMKLKSTVFVGHSMSGMIGCLASIKRPELFQKLVLLGASPRYLDSDDYEGGFSASAIEQLIAAMESNYVNWTAGFVPFVLGSGHQPSVDRFRKCLLRMRQEVAVDLAKTVFYSDHRDILDKVSVPCAIVHTTNDVVVPNSTALYMQKRISAGKSEVTIDMMELDGHAPQLTSHEQLTDVLARVLGVSPVDRNPGLDYF